MSRMQLRKQFKSAVTGDYLNNRKERFMLHKHAAFLMTAVVVMALVGYASAQTTYYNWSVATPDEGAWMTGTNWSVGSAPTSASNHYARIDNDGTAVVFDGDSATAGRVSLGHQSGKSGFLDIRSGGNLTASRMYVGSAGMGSVSQAGTVSLSSVFTLGDSATGQGTYLLESGGLLS